MTKCTNSIFSVIVLLALLMTALTGCSNGDKETLAAANTNASATGTAEPVSTEEVTATVEPTSVPTDELSIVLDDDSDETADDAIGDLDATQRNSMSMLNYLAVLTQEINESKNSRLYLEGAYSLLINNTHPNTIDQATNDHLLFMLDTLETYRMITVKRDRLQFVYEQNQAQAIRDAVPNPLAVLNVVQSFDWKKIAASIVYMAVDSYTSYKSSSATADLQFIQDGWALEDEEAANLHGIRKETFGYMVDMVGEYKLPGDLALSENAVDEFVNWKNNTNVAQRTRYLESNQETYKALGEYWLVLAESYYSDGKYMESMQALATYESLNIRIFRKDYQFAKLLPLAIISAGDVYTGEEYVTAAGQYAEKILKNTDDHEWALRYFAAQAFIDLYAKTNDSKYLRKAYEIALDNVNYLVNEQKTQNAEYLADVKVEAVPKDATTEEKAEIENYNKQINEDRKMALPPVYEPFVLNCDLLFSLAKQIGISEEEKANIDAILHENGADIILIPTVDNLYRFGDGSTTVDTASMEIAFNGKELTLPAKYVARDAAIKVTVTKTNADEPTVFEDWAVLKVDRTNKEDVDTFTATLASPTAVKYEYAAGSTIQIEVIAEKESAAASLDFSYLTVNMKDQWWKNVEFWTNGIGFKRVT